jgi:hypothetical protein
VRNYFNTAGFERWNKIYGETNEVSAQARTGAHYYRPTGLARPPAGRGEGKPFRPRVRHRPRLRPPPAQVNKVQLDIRQGHAQTVEKVLKWVDEEGGVAGVTVADCGCGTGGWPARAHACAMGTWLLGLACAGGGRLQGARPRAACSERQPERAGAAPLLRRQPGHPAGPARRQRQRQRHQQRHGPGGGAQVGARARPCPPACLPACPAGATADAPGPGRRQSQLRPGPRMQHAGPQQLSLPAPGA